MMTLGMREAIDAIKAKAYDLIIARQCETDVIRKEACNMALSILIEVVKDLEAENVQPL